LRDTFQRVSRLWFVLGIVLIQCVAVVPSHATSRSPDLPKVPCRLTPDDTAVYVTVLKYSGVWKPQVDPGSIQAYTLTSKTGNWNTPLGPLDPSAQAMLDQAGEETRADFGSKSTKSCFIGAFKKRDINRTAEANSANSVRSDVKRQASAPVYWSGVIRLPRIGFSPAKDEALVYAESSCGSSCAGGDLFLLRKRGDHWEIISQRNLWLS